MKQSPQVFLSSVLDIFYVYDFNQPQTPKRQDFLFNHNRHNEFNVNVGMVKVGLEHPKYRAHFALHAGTYSNDNYAAEPGVLKNIFEAHGGLSLTRKNRLWLDVGVFPSHIGFESAIAFDNWTMTRSLLADNSPYFFTGAKLTYHPHHKWEIALLLLNGWQRIQRLPGNSMPSGGTQIKFCPNEKITLNYSTFIGTDDPDTSRRMRYFNNFYAVFLPSKNFGLIAGCDVGIQQRTKNSSSYDIWFSPVIIGRYEISRNWSMAARVEYYQDKSGVIISTNTPNGFSTFGASFNLDYSPIENIICRLEGRWMISENEIFRSKRYITNNNCHIGSH